MMGFLPTYAHDTASITCSISDSRHERQVALGSLRMVPLTPTMLSQYTKLPKWPQHLAPLQRIRAIFLGS